MTGSVVCGVDASEAGPSVVGLARRLADGLGLRLVLVHAVSPRVVAAGSVGGGVGAWDGVEGVEEAGNAAQLLLERLAAGLPAGAAELRRELGSAAAALARVAVEERAELLVVGSRGRGRLLAALLGSVSAAVAAGGPCPVVVVPHGAEREHEPASGTIVCGLDESDGARSALRVADGLAARLSARLVLAHAAPIRHVAGTARVPGAVAELRRIDVEEGEELLLELAESVGVRSAYERRVAFGTPGGTLADVAEEEAAGLVVVGSHGRGVLRAAVLGSVSIDLVAAARCPVVVVPPAAR